MNKLKIITTTSLIFSLLTFFTYFIFSFSSGGCYVKTEIANLSIPEGLKIEVVPGTCVERFSIINHEDNLTLYAIKGKTIIYNDGREEIVDKNSCLEEDPWPKGLTHSADDFNMCKPVNMSVDQEYSVEGIRDSWELFTDKGVIKGFASYSEPSEEMSKKVLVGAEILGGIFLISFILSFVLKKKESK